MADYTKLIDEETWAFIRRTAEYYPDDAVSLNIAEQRTAYDALCRAFGGDLPDGVSTEDVSADGVPCRVYTAGHPTLTVVYFHGGGFVVGGLESHSSICAEICAQTGYRVVAVDYRLAPEHKHPAAFDDAWTATQWAETTFQTRIVLAGDSAGGNLAAAVSHYARGKLDCLMGQVLVYPALGGDMATGSYVEHAEAPLLTRADIAFYSSVRTGGAPPDDDPTFSPLLDSDFSDLPPTVVLTADCDPIRDDGRVYVDRIKRAGGHAEWINEPGLVHGYLRARDMVGRAAESFSGFVLAIETLGQGLWPYE